MEGLLMSRVDTGHAGSAHGSFDEIASTSSLQEATEGRSNQSSSSRSSGGGGMRTAGPMGSSDLPPAIRHAPAPRARAFGGNSPFLQLFSSRFSPGSENFLGSRITYDPPV